MKTLNYKLLGMTLTLLTLCTSCEDVNLCGERGTLHVSNTSLHTTQKVIVNNTNYGSLDPGEDKELSLPEGRYEVELRGISEGSGCNPNVVYIVECQTESFGCSY